MMITKINYNLNNYNSRMPSFKGYNDETRDVTSKNQQNWCLHETAFFRDIDTMEFAQKYITQNFPQGTNIADFGCSDGEEAYTLLMLLNKKNKDKKYKVSGYDVSPKAIELAKTGPFKINYTFIEGFVISDVKCKDYNKKSLRELFFSCFEKIPEKFFDINIGPIVETKKLIEQEIQKERNPIRLLNLKRLRTIFGHECDYTPRNTFVPKSEFANDIFEPKLGDISDISKIVKPNGETGVVMFKNAWYHVLGTYETFDNANIKGAEKIIQSAHNALPEKGLLVVGNLWKDHLYSDQKAHLLFQNNKLIQVVDNTPFHDLLRKNGFVPVFYERIKDILLGELDKSKIHLPSVWRKI